MWLCLMKSRSELFSMFAKFYHEIKKPQQNRVAKRKNRHLVETTQTFLLNNNVPLRFWG
uniref:Uncharacterized protein n=1 Tax=Cajanus cajan TaxID=3821 RepID=A0A151TPH9_CAJCA|nr:hypothetical protein KK1_022625 [Cajanus cajan]